MVPRPNAQNLKKSFTIMTASLGDKLVKGYKNLENRKFKMSKGWWAVCLGKTAAFDVPAQPGVAGVVYVEGTLPYEACAHCASASNENGWNLCNVITAAIEFKQTHTMNGAQGVRVLGDHDKTELLKLCVDGTFRENKEAVALLQKKGGKPL